MLGSRYLAGAAGLLAVACAVGSEEEGGEDGGVLESGDGSVASTTGSGAADSTGTDPDTGADPATSSDGNGSSDDRPGWDSDSGSCTEIFFYPDVDGDGHGDPDSPTLACALPPGHVETLDDCDDNDPDNAPSIEEVCDGQDNDCDGLVDELSAANAMCNGCALTVIGEHGYAFCPMPTDFDTARATCQAFAGDLLKLEDAAEITALVGEGIPPSMGVGGYFIGLNDRAVEGTYVWADDTPAVFTNYNMGEPNDAGGAEDCTEMDTAVGVWNDISCDARAFICEAAPPRR